MSSCVFGIDFRDRQGSVGLLSRFLFAVYLDDLGKLCNSQIGCFVIFVLFLLLFYADDILLIFLFVMYLELHAHNMNRISRHVHEP